jgi:hypothetical protein
MEFIKNINFIKTFIKRIYIKEQILPLGRWNIDYCNKKINNKIDLSNEDHCGPCGQYIIKKLSNKNYDEKYYELKK